MSVIDDSCLSESALEGNFQADFNYLSEEESVLFEHITDKESEPYHIRTCIVKKTSKLYNPKYGDSRKCKCGHSYHRHFDSWDGMFACGCKYCGCTNFVEDISDSEEGVKSNG